MVPGCHAGFSPQGPRPGRERTPVRVDVHGPRQLLHCRLGRQIPLQFLASVTAIRNGDQDGNDATERDAGWLPLNATPMHPEYPSQAGINAGAARGILESVFGTGPESFAATDIADARLSRQFNSFAQMAEEHKEVRIWGGIHFRNSLNVGEAMGRKIADHLVANYLKPTR